MIIQKSSFLESSTLYLVPTPIGNFSDMTYRAVEVLNNVDYIFAEDTRVTKNLLSHFNIKTQLKSYHSFNEEESSNEIIKLLNEGCNIAIVSDAGMPAISDPGYLIVRKALDEKYSVVSLPGANAALTALVASGIPSERFLFYGFLKHKTTQKEKELRDLIDFKETLIFYESTHRIKETINIMYSIFGNRQIVIARELTKRFEEYIRGDLETIKDYEFTTKGEFVIILNGASIEYEIQNLNNLDIMDHYEHYLDEGYSSMDAIKRVAKDRNVSKNTIYKVVNKIN